MQLIRTILADDHRVFREGLKVVLKKISDTMVEVVGEADTGEEVIQLLKRKEADLLILDLNMPEMDGLEALPMIRKRYKMLKILVLTAYADPKIVKESFKGGANGYVLKSSGIDELCRGIKDVLDGKTFISSGMRSLSNVSPALNGKVPTENNRFEDRFVQKHHLTKREMEILKLIPQAKNNKEIGKELFISDQTVSVHRKNIMRKLGVNSTASLIKLAFEFKLR